MWFLDGLRWLLSVVGLRSVFGHKFWDMVGQRHAASWDNLAPLDMLDEISGEVAFCNFVLLILFAAGGRMHGNRFCLAVAKASRDLWNRFCLAVARASRDLRNSCYCVKMCSVPSIQLTSGDGWLDTSSDEGRRELRNAAPHADLREMLLSWTQTTLFDLRQKQACFKVCNIVLRSDTLGTFAVATVMRLLELFSERFRVSENNPSSIYHHILHLIHARTYPLNLSISLSGG